MKLFGCVNIKTEINIKSLPSNDGIGRVYMIIDNETVIYVGKSKSLMSRMQAHRVNGYFKTGMSVKYGECDMKDMLEKEHTNIFTYQPRLNKRVPLVADHTPVDRFPIQTYITPEEREKFIKICQLLDNGSASMTLRKFVQRQIKKHKGLL